MLLQTSFGEAKRLERVKALEYAEKYCEQNGLSMNELKKQEFQRIGDMMIFAQPSDVEPDGLRNDIATQPLPTLVVRLDENGKMVKCEPTVHTKRFLSE